MLKVVCSPETDSWQKILLYVFGFDITLFCQPTMNVKLFFMKSSNEVNPAETQLLLISVIKGGG